MSKKKWFVWCLTGLTINTFITGQMLASHMNFSFQGHFVTGIMSPVFGLVLTLGQMVGEYKPMTKKKTVALLFMTLCVFLLTDQIMFGNMIRH